MPDIQHNIITYNVRTNQNPRPPNKKKGVSIMNGLRTITFLVLVLVIGLMLITGEQPCVALETDYASGVNAKNGDASPAAGYSSGETNSRVDDYIHQDEQINLDADAGLVKVLRTNQKTSVNDYVQAVIPCKNVNPRELRGPIRSLVYKEGGEADVVQDKVNGEYFLHVTCPSFQLPYVKAAIEALDEKWVRERDDGSAELYYQARFRDINKILNVTKFYRGPEGSFIVDQLNNALYYHDQPATMGLQKWGLQTVDIPSNQVSFDVAIYEIDTSNGYKLGLDYVAWKNGPGRNLFYGLTQYAHIHGHYYIDYPGFSGDNSVSLHDIIDNPRLRVRYGSFNYLATAAYVDFLATRGKAKLLTRVNVLARSGTTAEVAAVQEIASFRPGHLPPPVAAATLDDRSDNAEKDDGNPAAEEPSALVHKNDGAEVVVPDGIPFPMDAGYDRVLDYVKAGSVGVRANITPFVGQESTEAALDVSVSDVNGYSPQGYPMINTRYVHSYIRLKDGEPYVIGGIKRKETIKSTAKVPFLGDLPVLGWLVGGEQDVVRETELVIVITPKVIIGSDSDLEMAEQADTLRDTGMQLSDETKAVIAQANGEAELKIPSNPFGFDQWLLGKEK